MPKTIRRSFEDFKGVDKSFSPLTKPVNNAETADNCIITNSFDLEQRPGEKLAAHSYVTEASPFAYSYVNTDGDQVNELITVGHADTADYNDTGFKKLKESTLSITYTGGQVATFSFLPDGTDWVLTVLLDGSPASGFPKTYGTGLEGGGNVDLLSTLVSDWNGLSNWTVTATDTSVNGSEAIQAAVLPVMSLQTATSTATEITYYHLEVIDGGTAWGYDQVVDNVGFTLPSLVSLDDCVYAAFDRAESDYRVFKYDGHRMYRSGVPGEFDKAVLNIVSGSAGSVFAANTQWTYQVRYVRVDARGNVREGDLSSTFSFTTGGTALASLTLTIPTWQEALNEWDVRSGVVNGNQTSVTTITLTSGHDLVTGDTAYFYDSSTSEYVEREVTSTTATTIVIAGAAVDVDNGRYVSNNVRIEIWRTKGDSNSPYYFVEAVPNYTHASSANYSDTIADNSLTINLIEPDITRGQPPLSSYLASHQGLLFAAGDPENPNRLSYNDVTGTEYFDPDLTYLDIPFTDSGPITGLGSDGQRLFVFKPNERAVIHGDFITNSIFVEVASDGVGAVVHSSIVRGEVGLYFISTRGPQRLINGELDLSFNLRMAPDFDRQQYDLVASTAISSDDEDKIRVDRAVSFYDYRNKHVHMCVPAFSGTPLGVAVAVMAPNTNTWWYIYDEKQDAFTSWSGVEGTTPALGGTVFKEDLYYCGYAQVGSGASSSIEGFLLKQHSRGDLYDGANNHAAISFDYRAAHDALDSPSVFKKWVRLRTWSMRTAGRAVATLTVNLYKNFIESTSISSFTQAFTASTTLERRNKISGNKATSMQVRYQNSTLHEIPRITGYEMEVSLPYDGGELEKP